MLAVLVSGSFRTFDRTWETNLRFLNQLPIPFKVYLHTWSHDYSTPRNPLRDGNAQNFYFKLRPLLYPESSKEITRDYLASIVNSAVIEIDHFSVDKYIDELNLANYSHLPQYINMLNSGAMYDGIERVKNLFLQNFSEDVTHFLRIRTDYELSSEFLKYDFGQNEFWSFGKPVHYKEFSMSDLSFMGSWTKHSQILNTYSYYKKVSQSPSGLIVNSKPFYAENVLLHHAESLGFKPDYMKNCPSGLLLRPEPIPDRQKSFLKHLLEIGNHNLSILKAKSISCLINSAKRFKSP